MARVIFVFLDGLGLATSPPDCGSRAAADNPVCLYRWSYLKPLLKSGILLPLDATLGVEGTPQSATGQVSLLTGRSAQRELGHHLAAYPNAQLQDILGRDNVLKRVASAGLQATFANAYTRQYFELVEAGKLRHSATTLCVLSAGLPFRLLEDLLAGRAVYWDITNVHLRQREGYEHVPEIGPQEAGRRLARLAYDHALVLFECFEPDRLGHQKDREGALVFLSVLDRFLTSCAEAMPLDATLVVSSDHGNLEDLSTGAHTSNPVPLLALGAGVEEFAGATRITDVAPAIYRLLRV
ncbi:MAG: hypothetical protein HPY83_05685 [Anaerolineae bacterium]|nr:hypothetical protein [Anaerolineae bacterium]